MDTRFLVPRLTASPITSSQKAELGSSVRWWFMGLELRRLPQILLVLVRRTIN